jgi:hypothetical protein
MKSVEEAIENEAYGLYYGNRALLPFPCFLLKVIIDDEIIMDFSASSKAIIVNVFSDITEIYFKQYQNLKDAVSKFESIKLIVVEKDKDIFNFDNHIKIVLHVEDDHKLKIEKTDEDILFIE